MAEHAAWFVDHRRRDDDTFASDVRVTHLYGAVPNTVASYDANNERYKAEEHVVVRHGPVLHVFAEPGSFAFEPESLLGVYPLSLVDGMVGKDHAAVILDEVRSHMDRSVVTPTLAAVQDVVSDLLWCWEPTERAVAYVNCGIGSTFDALWDETWRDKFIPSTGKSPYHGLSASNCGCSDGSGTAFTVTEWREWACTCFVVYRRARTTLVMSTPTPHTAGCCSKLLFEIDACLEMMMGSDREHWLHAQMLWTLSKSRSGAVDDEGHVWAMRLFRMMVMSAVQALGGLVEVLPVDGFHNILALACAEIPVLRAMPVHEETFMIKLWRLRRAFFRAVWGSFVPAGYSEKDASVMTGLFVPYGCVSSDISSEVAKCITMAFASTFSAGISLETVPCARSGIVSVLSLDEYAELCLHVDDADAAVPETVPDHGVERRIWSWTAREERWKSFTAYRASSVDAPDEHGAETETWARQRAMGTTPAVTMAHVVYPGNGDAITPTSLVPGAGMIFAISFQGVTLAAFVNGVFATCANDWKRHIASVTSELRSVAPLVRAHPCIMRHMQSTKSARVRHVSQRQAVSIDFQKEAHLFFPTLRLQQQ